MKVLGLVGVKLGMTRVFDQDGINIPVSVVQAGPCTVIALRKKEKDGKDAVLLGFEKVKLEKLNKPMRGLFEKIGLDHGYRYLKEFPVVLDSDETPEPGTIIKASDVFKPGMKVDIRGISKGRGFQGVMKRWGFSGGPDSHGSSLFHRRPGSIGTTTFPGRVLKGKKMAGHMGNAWVTVVNLSLVDIVDGDLLLVKGAVPGHKKGIVLVTPSKRYGDQTQ